MSIGNYLATKTRDEYVAKEKKREEWEIENMVEQETQEIRDIYARKDFKDELLEDIVSIITKKRSVWVDTMMREELGLIESKGRALDNALGLRRFANEPSTDLLACKVSIYDWYLCR